MPFYINYEIKPSIIPNAGNGVFAKQFIPKNTLVWQPTKDSVLELTIDQLKIMESSFNGSELINTFISHMYYDSIIDKYIFCCDDGRYINHSHRENCSHGCKRQNATYSIRDIQIGEELYENYDTEYEYDHWLNPNSDFIDKLFDDHDIQYGGSTKLTFSDPREMYAFYNIKCIKLERLLKRNNIIHM